MKRSYFRKRIGMISLGTVMALGLGMKMPVQAAVTQADLKNPVRDAATHIKDEGTQNGEHKTDFRYVYFGSYPQKEITGAELTSDIINAKYDANCDAVVNGKKYRRISYDMIYVTGSINDMQYTKETWKAGATNGYRYYRYEPIKWKILNNDGNRLFLWSANILNYKWYERSYNNDKTWETGSMRQWLNYNGAMPEEVRKTHNGEPGFYVSAFSDEDKGRILTTHVVQDVNPYTGTKNGNDTYDKVFLPGFDEMTNEIYGFCICKRNEYLYEGGDAWQVGKSKYAHDMNSRYGTNDPAAWWLRTDGAQAGFAAIISSNAEGSLADLYGHGSNVGIIGVVPAINISYNLSDCIRVSFETNGAGTIEDQILIGSNYAQEPVVQEGQRLETKRVMKKEGYVFTGWYTDKECTRAYRFDRKLTQDGFYVFPLNSIERVWVKHYGKQNLWGTSGYYYLHIQSGIWEEKVDVYYTSEEGADEVLEYIHGSIYKV